MHWNSGLIRMVLTNMGSFSGRTNLTNHLMHIYIHTAYLHLDQSMRLCLQDLNSLLQIHIPPHFWHYTGQTTHTTPMISLYNCLLLRKVKKDMPWGRHVFMNGGKFYSVIVTLISDTYSTETDIHSLQQLQAIKKVLLLGKLSCLMWEFLFFNQ